MSKKAVRIHQKVAARGRNGRRETEGAKLTCMPIPTLPKAPSTKDEEEHANLGAIEYAMVASVVETEGVDPMYHEARQCPNWPKWHEAIKTELECLDKAETWDITKQPKDK